MSRLRAITPDELFCAAAVRAWLDGTLPPGITSAFDAAEADKAAT